MEIPSRRFLTCQREGTEGKTQDILNLWVFFHHLWEGFLKKETGWTTTDRCSKAACKIWRTVQQWGQAVGNLSKQLFYLFFWALSVYFSVYPTPAIPLFFPYAHVFCLSADSHHSTLEHFQLGHIFLDFLLILWVFPWLFAEDCGLLPWANQDYKTTVLTR